VNILVLRDYYLPGYKSGGPIRTIANLVDRLGHEFQFKIICADRDSGDEKPYSNIKLGDWNRVGNAMVFYMSFDERSSLNFRNVIKSIECDLVYLNSFFSAQFTIQYLILRKVGMVSDRPLVIAPRGEFSPAALALKSYKKRLFIVLARVLRLYEGAVWQASSEYEEANIRRLFGKRVKVIVAPNPPPIIGNLGCSAEPIEKVKGCLRIIFLGRICPMKNLNGALKMLLTVKGTVVFNIYGPVEDRRYWAECKRIMSSLPENVVAQYCGEVVHERVGITMSSHHILFLPTLGENFGHVILEAVSVGCPVLISDQTPWRYLEEKGVGWDLPLTNAEGFKEVLQRCVNMDHQEYVSVSEKAREYGRRMFENGDVIEKNRQLFYQVAQISKVHDGVGTSSLTGVQV